MGKKGRGCLSSYKEQHGSRAAGAITGRSNHVLNAMSCVREPLGHVGHDRSGKKAQRTMGSCRKDRGSPTYGELWADKKLYKSEERDNKGGTILYQETMCVYIIYT